MWREYAQTCGTGIYNVVRHNNERNHLGEKARPFLVPLNKEADRTLLS